MSAGGPPDDLKTPGIAPAEVWPRATDIILEPDAVAWRLRFRRHKRRCPVLRSVFEAGRRVPPGERAAWLEQVVAYGGHRLVDTRTSP